MRPSPRRRGVRLREQPARLAISALALGLSLAALGSAPIVQAQATPTELPTDVRAALASAVDRARDRTGAPGLSAAVVRDGRVVWAGASGLADLEQDVPARPETVYRIASISKPIAATAVMQLVERGVVSLDDPIQRYVPAFPRKPQGEVRLHHLLSHTSGIRHYRGREMESRERYGDVASAVRIFGNDPLQSAPGTTYLYSTYGYNLLAGVVERASGLPYEQYLRERIFQPAGMTATALEHPDALVRFRARQYSRTGRDGPLRNAPYVDLSNKWAGGGVISTVLDLAGFDMALNDGRLLTPGTLARMYSPTRLTSGQLTGYGLGWMVVHDSRGRTWVAHSGGATGGTTYLLRRPDARVAVALLSNVDNAEGLRDIALQLADLATGDQPAAQP